ncbi:MAG: hypothetical protein A2681_02335 [Candidatus Liptonbacteria bacterium RIFCSPHIGHO2_01_FULL_56_18b]|nr:MAG: hypothetical protein UY96_C0036G0002 [Parcubacteria group bacterium GW2011_GWB1_56_8]OGY97591.1 MAG: hypothetical protein A2681_02335 [Candidatus Liptonbacteria bacterium RIFCSPHIGHO2_01_FULL_56_18b]
MTAEGDRWKGKTQVHYSMTRGHAVLEFHPPRHSRDGYFEYHLPGGSRLGPFFASSPEDVANLRDFLHRTLGSRQDVHDALAFVKRHQKARY